MIEFIIIVEAEADFSIASEIAERIIVEQVDWIQDYLDVNMQWRGLQEETRYTCWKHIRNIIDEYKQQGMHLPRFLRRREPFKADGATAYKILHLVERLKRNRECIHAVIFIRDLDNQPERWDGLAQARTEFEHRDLAVAIVIGVANSKREAWVLNGFVPCDAAEEERLRSLKQQLSFDPTVDAHRLRERTFQEPDRIRNVKVVLSVLTGDDGEREAMCWQQMSLALLRERGVQTGLSAYMNEVWERMVPIISS